MSSESRIISPQAWWSPTTYHLTIIEPLRNFKRTNTTFRVSFNPQQSLQRSCAKVIISKHSLMAIIRIDQIVRYANTIVENLYIFIVHTAYMNISSYIFGEISRIHIQRQLKKIMDAFFFHQRVREYSCLYVKLDNGDMGLSKNFAMLNKPIELPSCRLLCACHVPFVFAWARLCVVSLVLRNEKKTHKVVICFLIVRMQSERYAKPKFAT